MLLASKRGHTKEDVKRSAKLIKKYGFGLGLQMMTGLPCDTEEKSIKTAKEIIKLKPSIVRIYPTLVLKETKLCKCYEKGEYKPQTLDEAVSVCKKLIPMFEKKGIRVIRVSLATTEEIRDGGSVVAGPYHPAFRELSEGEIYFDKILKLLKKYPKARTFSVNPKEISKAVGNGKKNITRIEEKYGFLITIKPDDTIDTGKIKVWKE